MSAAATNPATGLTKKREEFCYQVVLLGDPNRAYRVAYDNWTMSQPAVRVEASRLLQDQKVQDRIADLQVVADRKLEVSIERIAKELARIGFADPGMLYEDTGAPIPLHLLPEDVRRAVHSITIIERQMVAPVKVEVDKDGVLREAGAPAPKAKLTKAEKRGAKAEKKLAKGAAIESPTSIEFMPMREKKITLHDKQPALQTMARWKKMIQDKPAEGDLDPNDVRSLTDEQLEAEIRANQEMLKTVDSLRKRSKRVPIPKAG